MEAIDAGDEVRFWIYLEVEAKEFANSQDRRYEDRNEGSFQSFNGKTGGKTLLLSEVRKTLTVEIWGAVRFWV